MDEGLSSVRAHAQLLILPPLSKSVLPITTTTTKPVLDLASLEQRIAALERKHHGIPTGCNSVKEVDEPMRRARTAVEGLGIYSARWKWVRPNYYDTPLTERAKWLEGDAQQLGKLCKSLLLENKKFNPNLSKNVNLNPKFVLVVLQYQAEFNQSKLATAFQRQWRRQANKKPDLEFDFRLADEADNDRLTGYSKGSVTPFGLLAGNQLKIVLSEAVLPLHFFWMGGGHELLKLGMAVSDFLNATQALVADVSDPRDGGDDE